MASGMGSRVGVWNAVAWIFIRSVYTTREASAECSAIRDTSKKHGIGAHSVMRSISTGHYLAGTCSVPETAQQVLLRHYETRHSSY
eukprot:2491010-Rhodomonas_salina.1